MGYEYSDSEVNDSKMEEPGNDEEEESMKTTTTDAQLIPCLCGAHFCFCCSQAWHEPITCEYLKLWFKRCQYDSETFNWIVVNTKECPKCQGTIEKNGGSHELTCRYQICWLCMGDWKAHTQRGCNGYTDAEKDKDREKSRASLNRYLV